MNENEEQAYMEWRRSVFGDDFPDSDDVYRACFTAGIACERKHSSGNSSEAK